MSTSRAGRRTLKRVAVPPSLSGRKKKGTPPAEDARGGGGKEEKEGGVADDDDGRVKELEEFTGLPRASCVSLLKRAGGNVEAAVNAHFLTLSPPPKRKHPPALRDDNIKNREEADLEPHHHHVVKSSNQLTLKQSGFGAATPAAAASAQPLTRGAGAGATATTSSKPPPSTSSEQPPLFRPPPLPPRRRVPIASVGERWRAVPNARQAAAAAAAAAGGGGSASAAGSEIAGGESVSSSVHDVSGLEMQASMPPPPVVTVTDDALMMREATRRGSHLSAATRPGSSGSGSGFDRPRRPALTDLAVPLRGRAVRGRRCAPPPPPGTWVNIEREPDNPADPRGAVKCHVANEKMHRLIRATTTDAAVVAAEPRAEEQAAATAAAADDDDDDEDDDDASRFLGYLPRSVSCHLSPWIDSGALTVSGRVIQAIEGGGESGGGGNRQDGETDDVTVLLIATATTAATTADNVATAAADTASTDAIISGGDDEIIDGVTCAWAAAAAAAAEEDAAGGGSRLAELTRTRMWAAVNQVRKSSDAALLTANETAALEALQGLDHAAQSLAIRLLQRKTGWIRTRALEGRYREVPDIATAAALLHSAGLVRSADDEEGEEEEEGEDNLRARLDSLTREELAEVARAVGKPDRGRRFDVTAALLTAPRHLVLAGWRFELTHDGGGGGEFGGVIEGNVLGGALRLHPALVSAVRVIMFLTFLDFSLANLASLVFQEIGVVRFPRRRAGEDGGGDGGDGAKGHAIDVESGDQVMTPCLPPPPPPPPPPPLFPSRAALDEYTAAAEVAGEVDAALEAGDETKALRLLRPVLAPFLEPPEVTAGERTDHSGGGGGGGGLCVVDVDVAVVDVSDCGVFARFDVRWIVAQMATVGVGLLERRGRYADATRVLFSLLSGCAAPNRRGGWYIRAATNLGHLGRANAALRVCEAGLGDTWVRCGDRLGLQRRALRLAKKCKRWAVAGAAWRMDAEWEAQLERVRGVALNEKVAEKNRYKRPLSPPGGEGEKEERGGLAAVVDGGGGEQTAAAAAAALAAAPAPAPAAAAAEGASSLGRDDDVIVIDGSHDVVHASSSKAGRGKKQTHSGGAPVAVDDSSAAASAASSGRSDTVTVEELALAHYASAAGGGWRGVHSEGTAWSTLFGLLFADILLASPPGVSRREVFRSDFQSAPLDLDADVFLPRRHRAVTSRLDEIRRDPGAASRLLTRAWMSHYGSALRGVSWTLMTLGELRDVAEGMGGAALADVCALKAEDYGGWSGGAPDLLLWRPAAPATATQAATKAAAKAVEVKSRNDTLSDQQRAWLLALRDAGVCACVCKVE